MTTVARGAFKRAKTLVAIEADTAESERLKEDAKRKQNWKRWGPYLSERQWATVREDYSGDGSWWVGSTQGWYCTGRQRHALGKHSTRCNREVICSRPLQCTRCMAPLLLMRLLLHAVGAYMDWTWIALQCVVMSCVCAKTARGTRTWPTAKRPRQDACVHSGSTGLQVRSSIADNHPASYRSSQQVSFGRHFASQMFPMDGHCTAGWQGIDTIKPCNTSIQTHTIPAYTTHPWPPTH